MAEIISDPITLAAELRKLPGNKAVPDDSGELAFMMPEHHAYVWFQKYPDLISTDAQISRKAWIKFLSSEEGRPYVVHRNFGKKGLQNNHRIIVK